LSDIDKKIASGAAWMVAFKLIDRGLGLISTVVLARLLAPDDFGLVAMATVIIAALQLLVAFSLDVPLIQNPHAGRAQFDTAWTINLLFGLGAAAIVALLGHPAALYYSDARLEAVVYVLAAGFAIQALGNIGPVTFRRDMRFDQEFKFLLAKRVALLLVTIPLAFWLRSYWALVAGQLLGAIIGVALSYQASSYRPRLSLAARVELFHASKWLMLNNLTHFLNVRSAEFIIGRLLGAQSLGYYTIAYEVATLPTTELVAPINRAAFPGYAQLAGDLPQLRRSFLSVISMIALFALPAGIGIVVVADLMVPAVLGDKWLAVVPLLQVLSVYGVIQALQTNISYIYLATGRMHMIAVVGGCQFLLLLACLIPGMLLWGVQGAAWGYLLSVVLMIPVNQILLVRCMELSARTLGASLLRPLLASLLMGGAVYLFKGVLPAAHGSGGFLLALLACVALGAVVYMGASYLLWRGAGRPAGAEQVVLSKIVAAVRRAGGKLGWQGQA
jgi:O-antigen/teichoic acid export membrane protein